MANDENTKKQENRESTAPPDPDGPAPILDQLDMENELGTVRISENVIVAVVRRHALEVKGVVRFASGSIVGGLAEMIGKKSSDSSVVVDLDERQVNIGLTLVLEFGACIPEVAGLVQDVIRTKVEELTGKHVSRVDIVVQDLEDPAEKQPAATSPGKQIKE